MEPELRFDHLIHLSTPLGLYEHAQGTTPRVEHGFCVDDVARALVVTARVADPSAEVGALTDGYLTFLLEAQGEDGLMHNRRDSGGSWTDAASTDDHWGRAIWALCTAATTLADRSQAARALGGAITALCARSSWPRAMAYAALGAGRLLSGKQGERAALPLLTDARRVLAHARVNGPWPWPEARLTYANAVLPEAMIVIGDHLGDTSLRDDGLTLLAWLVREQSAGGHLSLVPSGGRSPGDAEPGYDQQPIEAAALAEACRTAYSVIGDNVWLDVIERCVAWFDGDNDSELVMHDPTTGGGYDGLERTSVNQNQGAESTLAWLSTLQLSRMSPVAVTR